MLTKLTVRNFKRFAEVEIELGNPVVFIGPNNSGKTAALQALALWEAGLRRWNEKRGGKSTPVKRPGVTINRRDLLAVPVRDTNLLWRDLAVRRVQTVSGKPKTENVRIEIVVEGVTDGKQWTCGLEFDYANQESFYCRPLRQDDGQRMPAPEAAAQLRMAFLQPMSGLAASEYRLDPGAVNVLLGEGRTAEVLRNLCYLISTQEGGAERWARVAQRIQELFGVDLEAPVYIPERGEILMSYREASRVRLELASAGRGLQQTLLLLAHLAVNRGAVLLLDEPDAHLEILRQRQTYQLLVEAARQQDSQIIAASHSEVILSEAADRDVVVAFLGRPHRIDDRGSQVLKALREIGFDQYYQAEQAGFVLYLEGSTDLAILRAFAETRGHTAKHHLARPFVHYVTNLPGKAREHFYGLREAKPDLVGFALFDRIAQPLQGSPDLREYMWKRREIDNYLCEPEALLAYAEASVQEETLGPLFAFGEKERRRRTMQECIEDFVPQVALRDRSDRWWVDTKASDDFLDRVFEAFFSKLDLPNLMRKTDYHVLARHVASERMDPEIHEVLDALSAMVARANSAPAHPT